MVDVNDGNMKHTFAAHTAMGWLEFKEKANSYFDKVSDDVCLGCWYSGTRESRKLTVLKCDEDWKKAMDKMREKALSAKLRAAAMEVEQVVSDALLMYWK